MAVPVLEGALERSAAAGRLDGRPGLRSPPVARSGRPPGGHRRPGRRAVAGGRRGLRHRPARLDGRGGPPGLRPRRGAVRRLDGGRRPTHGPHPLPARPLRVARVGGGGVGGRRPGRRGGGRGPRGPRCPGRLHPTAASRGCRPWPWPGSSSASSRRWWRRRRPDGRCRARRRTPGGDPGGRPTAGQGPGPISGRRWRDPLAPGGLHLRRCPGADPAPSVDLSIEEGELCLVVGATGSGKSTLLRVDQRTGAALHRRPPRRRGRRRPGASTRDHPPRELADVVGIVGQNPAASFVTDVVEDELAYTMENLGVPPTPCAGGWRTPWTCSVCTTCGTARCDPVGRPAAAGGHRGRARPRRPGYWCSTSPPRPSTRRPPRRCWPRWPGWSTTSA